ncbi:MAG: hypothetical protein HKN20_16795 [Gemmatimonadetes bacterium]|nr:hypothetical protein [Gemmatimonadota bacterium]
MVEENIPPILGISEIVLSVGDLPAMRAFYRDVLGFALHSEASHTQGPDADSTGDPTITFLTIRELETPLGQNGHPQMLVLIDFRRHVFARKRFTGLDPAQSSLNHLAFEIPRGAYDAYKTRLETLGLAPIETTFPALRARALFIKDPEGNTIELICHDPGAGDA